MVSGHLMALRNILSIVRFRRVGTYSFSLDRIYFSDKLSILSEVHFNCIHSTHVGKEVATDIVL